MISSIESKSSLPSGSGRKRQRVGRYVRADFGIVSDAVGIVSEDDGIVNEDAGENSRPGVRYHDEGRLNARWCGAAPILSTANRVLGRTASRGRKIEWVTSRLLLSSW